MNKYLTQINLPCIIKECIHSRARWMAKRYGRLNEDDLIQEGLTLTLGLLKEYPETNNLYIMKAINNHFSDIQREEISNIEKLSSIESETTTNRLDKKAIIDYKDRVAQGVSVDTRLDELLATSGPFTKTAILAAREGLELKDTAEQLGMNTSKLLDKLREENDDETYM